MFAGEKSRDRGQHRKDGRTQCHPGNPGGAAVFRAAMNMLLQMFEGNFRFFHYSSVRSTIPGSRRIATPIKEKTMTSGRFRRVRFIPVKICRRGSACV